MMSLWPPAAAAWRAFPVVRSQVSKIDLRRSLDLSNFCIETHVTHKAYLNSCLADPVAARNKKTLLRKVHTMESTLTIRLRPFPQQ